jgi:NitT/TauT family transport system substrate-binding protein
MKKALIFVLVLFSLLLAACGGKAEPETLKVAVLPILDALPMHVALDRGYFADQNLDVELVPVNSGPERDQLMQAGQIDAMINELVSVIFYNQHETQVVVVRFARTATADSPVFRILAAADSGIENVEDLAGVEIGVSEGTVIEYTTDRILENAGLTPDEIATIAVPSIPDRLNLLQSGQLSAANLPDPVSSLAILNGAIPIIDDSSLPEVGTSVISFSAKTLESKPDAVRRFLAALEMAVADLNQNPDQFNDLLAEKGLVPPPLLEGYQLPAYVTASVPSEAQWQDALDWTLEKGLIENEPAYGESVDASYLP